MRKEGIQAQLVINTLFEFYTHYTVVYCNRIFLVRLNLRRGKKYSGLIAEFCENLLCELISPQNENTKMKKRKREPNCW